MPSKNFNAAAARAWQDANSREEDAAYVTPYMAIAETLRTQNAKARAAAVEMIQQAFGLHAFDAATIARSAADLTQLREAIRSPRQRRYGQFKITYIEFDVVTWRILPSVENIRFEGERAWSSGKALRYGRHDISGPILGLSWPDTDYVISSLTGQTQKIWTQNAHSRSIPFRGIETPGLLSVARLALEDNPKIGVLDATDGFSRTVGAQRGSGVAVEDVLFTLQDEATENRLRQDLIDIRDSGEADLSGEAAAVAAARLRSSIMPRAQVIVAYSKIGVPERQQPTFDEVRRSLVGHIHLEPPLKFADTTQYALKSRIALDELQERGMLPEVYGFSSDRILGLLQGETEKDGQLTADDGAVAPLFADELLALAFEALVSQNDQKRTRVVNAAVHGLTGKRPDREARAALAADAALRANWIIRGKTEDSAFKGRRSTMQKVLGQTTLRLARLSRRPIEELVENAVEKLILRNQDLRDVGTAVSAEAAELGVLGLYCLVEGAQTPLLIRSTAKVNGEYLPEPQQVIERMVTSVNGIRQLGQTILDVRAHREPRLLTPGQAVVNGVLVNNDLLTRDDLFAYKKESWSISTVAAVTPEAQLWAHRQQLVDGVERLVATVESIQRIRDDEGVCLVDSQGLDVKKESDVLSLVSTELRAWSRAAQRAGVGTVFADSRGVDDDQDPESRTESDDFYDSEDEDIA